VAGHHIHTEQFASVNHVLAVGPQRGGRALPSVATIEQQGARAAGFESLDQGGQVREAAHFAKAFSGHFKVQVAHAIGFGAAGAHTCGFEQMLTHQMGQLAFHAANAEVDTGLAEVDGFELRMAVGHVQE